VTAGEAKVRVRDPGDGWLKVTVSQNVKRIYRALGIDSRVALTRLMLGAPARVPLR
jgi:hypothetical protein